MDYKLNYEKQLKIHTDREKTAVELINIVGHLMYEKSVELVLFRNPLINDSVASILKLHKKAKSIVFNPVSIYETLEIAKIISELNIKLAKVDIGKLAAEWKDKKEKNKNLNCFPFVKEKLDFIINAKVEKIIPKDIVLYGMGRIGRLVIRDLIHQFGKGQQLRLRAIVTRKIDEKTLEKRASLLRNDSVHQAFKGTVETDIENKHLIINGQIIKMIESEQPDTIDYTKYGIQDALIIDSTGIYTDRKSLSRHLKSKGISNVLLTAPGKEIPNIVVGINETEFDTKKESIFSAASCTTNAISPVLYSIENSLGIVNGHIETIHAYTNDQNLLDNMHKKPRRGRSSAINIVITSTGAGKAVSKILPVLKNKLTANAVRVPTPNGSLAVLSLQVKKQTSVEAINQIMRHISLEGRLVNQIEYEVDSELVSNDIISRTCCSIFDSNATIVSEDKKNIVLYVWYDNEFGYTKQVIRLAKYISGVRRNIYY